MGVPRTPRERWIDQGLAALAAGGPQAVRVEALAKALGVTKGGFYGYFADREQLLEEMLDRWERRAADEVINQVRSEGGDPKDMVRRAGQLTLSEELLPIDLAVRDWARRDKGVARRLRRVDNKRMALAREMISTFCDDPDEIEARALLAFCLAIGHHFLAATHPGGRPRAEFRLRAADIILKQDR
ncbi:TetR/AcrR family transcriptional regulator [Longispora albida]|uniref:TetR/AcrR family transcriptional regulator n=1 Tax=Longispora albida TaxID=203523 RepID=UPI0003619523|nr:TetR/AcrR family transcriptional regulator [Longispora albida]